MMNQPPPPSRLPVKILYFVLGFVAWFALNLPGILFVSHGDGFHYDWPETPWGYVINFLPLIVNVLVLGGLALTRYRAVAFGAMTAMALNLLFFSLCLGPLNAVTCFYWNLIE